MRRPYRPSNTEYGDKHGKLKFWFRGRINQKGNIEASEMRTPAMNREEDKEEEVTYDSHEGLINHNNNVRKPPKLYGDRGPSL